MIIKIIYGYLTATISIYTVGNNILIIIFKHFQTGMEIQFSSGR